MYVKEKNKKVSFNCHLCPKIFNHRGLFKRHLNSKHKTTEDSINMPTVSCEECPLKFLNNLSLEQHKGKVHNSTKTKKSFKCDQCSKEFSTYRSKKYHVDTIHSESAKVFQCSVCNFESKRNWQLKRHFSKLHGQNTKETTISSEVGRSQSYVKAKNIIEQFSTSGSKVKEIVNNSTNESSSNKTDNSLDENDMFDMIKTANLTDNQTVKVSKILKKKIGKKVCPSQLRKKLTERKKLLLPLFKMEKITITDKKGKESIKSAVIGDAPELQKEILNMRGLKIENIATVVSVDGGKGILKVTCNFIPKEEQDDGDYEMSGARKSMIVYAAEGVEENYNNVSSAFEKSKVADIDFKLSCDLKCLSIAIGIQSQSARHPCVYCEAAYDSKKGLWEKSSQYRTFENCEANYQRYISETNGGNKSKSKDFFNCINPPAECFKDCGPMRIIDKCPPQPLHVCKLGPFNHLIKNLAKQCPDEVSEFTKKVQVSQEKYHGGDYEGNEINKMLENINDLEELLDENYIDYIEGFKSIKELNEHVSGKELKSDYSEVIDRFTLNFLALNTNHRVSVTPKVHIIMEHLKDYCQET